MELAVDGIRCAGCMQAIESGLSREPAILGARVNLALKRVSVEWREALLRPEAVVDKLAALGFKAYPFVPERQEDGAVAEERSLMRRLGVAGFASMNIMLLSVAVWSGNSGDIDPTTRDFFHWLSALIALPTAAYAGRPFFESALRALKAGAVNMDVPITIGVVLALAMSVAETWSHGRHAYFDGVVMLLFFLLIGRYLDQLMRRRTRDLAGNLAALKAETATRLADRRQAGRSRRSRRSRPATASSSAPASASRSTASSRPAAPSSTRASSPARPRRPRSARASASMPAR